MTPVTENDQNPKATLECALSYAARGWHIFPAPRGEKKSHKSAERSNGSKWGKTTDADEIKRDFARWPEANIGIATGVESGFFVVEADTEEGHDVDGIASMAALEGKHGPLPRTLMAESPSGSIHYYFKWPQWREIRNSAGTSTSGIAPGVDVRGEGGMVIAPPSIRGNDTYKWITNEPIADAPEWLIELAIAASGGSGEREPGDEPEAELYDIEEALAVIPNDDLGWEDWNRVGMAAYRATGGRGFAAFDKWSQKSKKYDAAVTAERWHQFSRSKPNRIGAGTIFHLANEAQPRWRDLALARMQAQHEANLPRSIAMMQAQLEAEQAKEVTPETPTNAKVEAETQSEAKAESPPKAADKQAHAERSTAPVDLWAKFDPPPLPTDLLPRTIAEFATEQGELTGADPSGFAVAALTVCSASIRDQIRIKVKKYGGWVECTRLWTALVGPASHKKTPIILAAARTARDIDVELYRTYAAAKAKWDALPSDQRKRTERPKHTRLCLEDTTMEAAQEVLQDSPDGVLCVQDELSGWFGAMDKYASHRGAAKDRGFWLQSYNGGTYTFNRVSRGSGLIPNLSISLLGGIQPEPMRKVATDTVDDGLVQRIIPIMLAPGKVSRDAPVADATFKYGELVQRLHRLERPFDQIAFDDGAMKIRQELEEKHLDLTSLEAVNKKLAAHIGKYDGIFARLCLLWHCVESAEKSEEEMFPLVSEETADRVADFLHTFLLPHATAFYASVLGLSDDNDRLTAVAGYILAHELDVLTNRDIQRGDRTMRSLKRQDIEDIFCQLDALGWVERVQPLRATGAPTRCKVNPEVHRQFHERAENERERRNREREIISAALAGGRERRSSKD
jgi:Protein of unknown function (DUF3987)/Bifunctional DNA primase/polymerase, N-terminal/Primase C terminal 2 (PriCT-2)